MVYEKFIKLLEKYVNKFDKKDKFHLSGYNNASFDNEFLRNFFKRNNDNYFGSWFFSDSLDVMILASFKLMKERHLLEDFKLKTVAKHFGIAVDENRLHEAGYDVELTMQIFNKL